MNKKDMNKIFLSIIVPVFNEEANIFRAYSAIKVELESFKNIDFEIIFTDNHSTDSTFDEILKIACLDNRIKCLRFSRNFGFNRSILTGYRCATGDAAIQIDCDLEDPPSLFLDFIKLWKDGHDVVVGLRIKRQENLLLVYVRKIFYKLLNSISDTPHLTDAGDFRLVDRSILNQLKFIDDAKPYVRGLISELAINQATIKYTRNKREYGKSKFNFWQLIRFGLGAIFAYSVLPLRIATFVGIAVAFATLILCIFYIFARFVWPELWPAGFATTSVLILLGISLNSLFLGVLSEYVARIYLQGRRRPSVIIEKSININLAGSLYKGVDIG